MKVPLLILISVAASGCVSGGVTVTVTPSCLEQSLPQTKYVLMCSNVGSAQQHIDNGIVSGGCIRQDVKAPGIWNYRYSPRTNQTQTIISMGWGLDQYFWVVPEYISDQCYGIWY